ncbi:hypothetical protein [Kribbella sp. NBC_00889]|uniref:hypothetical protein n=1 Tax=Kribbella sp. NBC_00889 TaxID=2975974 RepID=UPI003864814F|nr:hypothetical protein OG817_31540 [Kribbella sp. NBC_00889]
MPDTTTAAEHRDTTPIAQPYRDGMFISTCGCGADFRGRDGDEADYLLVEHIHSATDTAN